MILAIARGIYSLGKGFVVSLGSASTAAISVGSYIADEAEKQGKPMELSSAQSQLVENLTAYLVATQCENPDIYFQGKWIDEVVLAGVGRHTVVREKQPVSFLSFPTETEGVYIAQFTFPKDDFTHYFTYKLITDKKLSSSNVVASDRLVIPDLVIKDATIPLKDEKNGIKAKLVYDQKATAEKARENLDAKAAAMRVASEG